MIAIREQEQINFKKNNVTTKQKENISPEKPKTTIANNNDVKTNIQSNNKNIINDSQKGEFEKLFSINSQKEKVDFLQNYKLGNVESLIDSKLKFPDNHLIVIINTKKALLELEGDQLKKDKNNKTEYDFSKSLFLRMWEIIIKFSQNLKKKNSFKNNSKNNNSAYSVNNLEIYESIKVFSLNDNLEFLYTITEPLNEQKANDLFLPLIKKCLKFSDSAQKCNLFNCLNMLFNSMQNDKKYFYENFSENLPNFYIDENSLPQKTEFYRILFFNGAITELIDINSFENLILQLKSKYNFVLNYFLFEHDYQYEKKVYKLLLKHNLIDYKILDFEIFMKKEDNNLNEFNEYVNNFYKNVNHLEKLIREFIEIFVETKNFFFGNPSFRDYQKKYDTEHSKLMQDYEIINKNNSKYIEFSKANINKEQIDYIKKYFSEMLNSRVINNHLHNVKNSVDFNKFNNLLNGMITEANDSFDVLIKDINSALIKLKDLDFKCDFYFEKVNYMLTLIDFLKLEFVKIKNCDMVLDATAKHMESMAKLSG